MKTLSAIKSKYYKLAKQISAPKKHVCFSMIPQHDGNPHVEFDGDHYLYIVTERGHTYETRITPDPDEILYWLISDLTFSMACDYELNNRRPNEDSRRQLFAKEIEYFGQISPKWAARKRKELDEILAEAPYNDRTG